jgi:hypothetical protein
MSRTILLIALIALALALALLLLEGSGDPGRNGGGALPESGAPAAAAGAGSGGVLPAGPGEITRAKLQPEQGADPSNPAFPDSQGPPVHLRVFLRYPDADGELVPPPHCSGWTVRAQTWLQQTRAIFIHEAAVDPRGIAEFTFPGFVHVDWLSCQPPAASGLGLSFLEQHEDMDGGSVIEWTLVLAPAGAIEGQVVDHRDDPVSGAIVHIYNPNWTYGLADWTPGFLRSTTDRGGRFRFPGIGAGDYVLAVEPGLWLQFEPALDSAEAGRNTATVVADETAAVGPLRVLAGGTLEVEVADAGGQGIAGLPVWAEPITFDSSVLAASVDRFEQWQVSPFGAVFGYAQDDAYQRFLAGENPADASALAEVITAEPDSAPTWPYGALFAETDAVGHAYLHLPHGRWRVSVGLGAAEGLYEPLAPQETQVPGVGLLFRMPVAHRAFRGRAVDLRGNPVTGAAVQLTRDGEYSLESRTGTDGSFTFAAVPALGHWILMIAPELDGLVPCNWDVSPADATEAVYCLPDSSVLRVLLRDGDGNPLQQDNLDLRLLPLDWRFPPPLPGAMEGRPLWQGSQEPLQIQLVDGRVSAVLPDGSYELIAGAYAWNGAWEAWGGAEYDLREIGRWIVEPRPEPWILDADPIPVHPDPSEMVHLSGLVTDAATGAPVPACQVVAFREDHLIGYGQSDPSGRYALSLAPGAANLHFAAPGYVLLGSTSENWAPGPAERDFRLAQGGSSFTVVLRDHAGARIPQCEIRFFDPSGTPRVLRTPQGRSRWGDTSIMAWSQDGRLELADIAPGPIVLEARFWDAFNARATLHVGGGESGEVEVRLDRTLDEIRAGLRGQSAGAEDEEK